MKGMETSGNPEASDQAADRLCRETRTVGASLWRAQVGYEAQGRVSRKPSRDQGRIPERGVKPTTSGRAEFTLGVGVSGERQDTSSPTAERMPRPLDGLIIGRAEPPGLIDEWSNPILRRLGDDPGVKLLIGERPYTRDFAERWQWYESGPKPGEEPGAHKAIADSVSETGKQFLAGLLEKAVVVVAHCIAPGVGHAVVLIFEAKELLEDVAAMASSDKPVELHIPLLHLPPGVELEVGVELGGAGAKDEPGLIVFFTPGDGGVLHGWGLEREKDEKEEEEAKRRKRTGPEEGAVIQADLSSVLRDSKDSEDVAAFLRHLGTRLQAELWKIDEYHQKPCITIYDKRAGLGLWLPRPEGADGAQQIALEEDAETGRLIVRLVARKPRRQ